MVGLRRQKIKNIYICVFFHARTKKNTMVVLIASATATTAASAIEVRKPFSRALKLLERLIPFQSSAFTKIRGTICIDPRVAHPTPLHRSTRPTRLAPCRRSLPRAFPCGPLCALPGEP